MATHSGGSRRQSRSLLERAGYQSERGAELLFARLDALHSRQDEAAQLLEHLAGRIREGEWSPRIASLVKTAEKLDERMPRGA